MGHAISALVVSAPVSSEVAARFDLKVAYRSQLHAVVALESSYVHHWAERLAAPGVVSDAPILNHRVVHVMARAIHKHAPFAIVETEYFGGDGDQAAAAYQGDDVLFPPQRGPVGVINAALRAIGVRSAPEHDEFETLGLHEHRSWHDVFRTYWSRR